MGVKTLEREESRKGAEDRQGDTKACVCTVLRIYINNGAVERKLNHHYHRKERN